MGVESSALSSQSGSMSKGVGAWWGIVAAGVVLGTWAWALYATVKNSLLPQNYLVIFSILYSVVLLFLSWRLIRVSRAKRGQVGRGRRLLIVVVTTVSLVFHGALISNAYVTDGLIRGLEESQTSTTSYVIVGKQDEGARTQDLAGAETLGLIDDELPNPELLEALSSHTSALVVPEENLSSVIDGLDSGDIQLAALRSGTLEMLRESQPDVYASLGEFATVSVESESDAVINADASQPFVLYLSGIDTFGEIGTTGRSDVNMLVAVNPISKKILLVNTPRDYYVQLHGTTGPPDKLTHAGVYGIETARMTMEDLFGVEVPYHARVNFSTLIELVGIIGPINVYSEQDFGDYQEGMNVLDGDAALDFSRTRYGFEDGDRQRGRNQQRVIAAIVSNLSSPRNALRLPQVLEHMQGSFETNLSEASMKQLFREQSRSSDSWEIVNLAVEGEDSQQSTYSMPGIPLYVMIPDRESVDLARERIHGVLEER